MRRFALTILSILYLAASTQATVQVHYCMGKFISASLSFSGAKESCDACGMKKKKGCCEDKQASFKTDKQYCAQKANVFIPRFSIEKLNHLSTEKCFIQLSSFALSYPLTHSPPLITKVPLYSSNCVFRI